MQLQKGTLVCRSLKLKKFLCHCHRYVKKGILSGTNDLLPEPGPVALDDGKRVCCCLSSPVCNKKIISETNDLRVKRGLQYRP